MIESLKWYVLNPDRLYDEHTVPLAWMAEQGKVALPQAVQPSFLARVHEDFGHTLPMEIFLIVGIPY